MIVEHATRAAQAASNTLQTAAVAGVASTSGIVPTIDSTAITTATTATTATASSGSSVPVGFSAVLLAVMLSTAGSAAAPRLTTPAVTRSSRLGGAAQHPGEAQDLHAALAGAAAISTSVASTIDAATGDTARDAPAPGPAIVTTVAAAPVGPATPGVPVAVATDAPPTPALTASLPPVPPTPDAQPLGGTTPQAGASGNLQALEPQAVGGTAPRVGVSENVHAVTDGHAGTTDDHAADHTRTTMDHTAARSAVDAQGLVQVPAALPAALVATAPAPVAHAANLPSIHQAAPAAGTSGLANVDRVRSVRAMAPNREVQRLALDLDGARVTVRFDDGHARVGVLADPDDTLGHGWVRQVERTIDQTVRATAAPTSGRSDHQPGDTSGDARERRAHTHATLTERATEDRHRTRWARAARDLAIQSGRTTAAGVI